MTKVLKSLTFIMEYVKVLSMLIQVLDHPNNLLLICERRVVYVPFKHNSRDASYHPMHKARLINFRSY